MVAAGWQWEKMVAAGKNGGSRGKWWQQRKMVAEGKMVAADK